MTVLSSRTSSPSFNIANLPLEVLRRVFDLAAPDQASACSFRLVSKTIGGWLDTVIYRDVKLTTRRASLSFLWTIQHSRTKREAFFSKTVRSLTCSSDVDPADVVRILGICRNVVGLTFWNRNHSSSSSATHGNGTTTPSSSSTSSRSGSPSPTGRGILSSKDSGGVLHVNANNDALTDPPDSVTFRQFLPPQLSLILHENMMYPFKPHFDLPFFHRVSHLSLLNEWQEWAQWFGPQHKGPSDPGKRAVNGYYKDNHRFSFLPSLTHLKLDLHVADSESERANPAGSRWKKKINTVSTALLTLLEECGRTLKVCVLVLRFDALPYETARAIRLQLDYHTTTNTTNTGKDKSTREIPLWKLVIAWERQPFRYMQADSHEDRLMWKGAEAVVERQRGMKDNLFVDCDQLMSSAAAESKPS